MSDKKVLEILNSKGLNCNSVVEVTEHEAEEVIEASSYGLQDNDTVYTHVADTDDPDIFYSLLVDDKDNKVVIHKIDMVDGDLMIVY